MSSLTDREIAIRQKLKDDFYHYARRCLKLRSKAGKIQEFNLNRSQRYVHEALEKQRKETGKVRALILKGRQIGISTYIAGRFYWRTTHGKGLRTVILTHLDDATANLFSVAKRFHEACPQKVRPSTGASNAKELSFDVLNSGYKVATAGSKDVGRSDTIQLFHGSEMAFWPHAETHSAGIGQAIADVEGTEDIRESTANGIGNAFHSLWKAAERGDSDFIAIFVPWFWHEEYRSPAPDGWSPPSEFMDMEAAYELHRDQTFWAYRKNRDLSVVAGGSSDEINWKFRQEYPSNADEAFQTSGDSFIPPSSVLKARKRKVDGYGPIILGVDPARGGGDKTGMVDRQGRRLGGHISKLIDNDDLMATVGEVSKEIKRLTPLGLKKVAIDTTGLGAGLYDRLRELHGSELIQAVNFAQSAYDKKHYTNRRAEMWDLMRQWLEEPAGVQVPDDDQFQGDICAPVRGKGATQFNSNSQLVLESKDHIKERLTHSPDLGDAAALTFSIDFSSLNETDWSYGNSSAGSGSWLGA